MDRFQLGCKKQRRQGASHRRCVADEIDDDARGAQRSASISRLALPHDHLTSTTYYQSHSNQIETNRQRTHVVPLGMLRAGGRRAAAAAVGRAPPRRGPCSSITASCGCQRTYPLARVRAIRSLSSSSSSSSTKAAETAQKPPTQPQPPPGTTVVARQVRTDQRGYKATLYFYAKDGAAAAAAASAGPPPAADGKGQGEAGEGEGEVTQSLRGTRYGKVAPPKDAASLQVCAGHDGPIGGNGSLIKSGEGPNALTNPSPSFSSQAVAEDGLRALLPRGYPRSVQKGYAEYVLLCTYTTCADSHHRPTHLSALFSSHTPPHPPHPNSYVKLQMTASLCSSAIGVLSTQSLLYAMGLGAGSVPLAAALNWIIKDGIGQIGGIVFARYARKQAGDPRGTWTDGLPANGITNHPNAHSHTHSVVNDRFDANPKRWKMVATISLDASCALELLAPLAPGYFLAIASLANVGMLQQKTRRILPASPDLIEFTHIYTPDSLPQARTSASSPPPPPARPSTTPSPGAKTWPTSPPRPARSSLSPPSSVRVWGVGAGVGVTTDRWLASIRPSTTPTPNHTNHTHTYIHNRDGPGHPSLLGARLGVDLPRAHLRHALLRAYLVQLPIPPPRLPQHAQRRGTYVHSCLFMQTQYGHASTHISLHHPNATADGAPPRAVPRHGARA